MAARGEEQLRRRVEALEARLAWRRPSWRAVLMSLVVVLVPLTGLAVISYLGSGPVILVFYFLLAAAAIHLASALGGWAPRGRGGRMGAMGAGALGGIGLLLMTGIVTSKMEVNEGPWQDIVTWWLAGMFGVPFVIFLAVAGGLTSRVSNKASWGPPDAPKDASGA